MKFGNRMADIPMKHEYTVIYERIEDDWVMATVPELPGVVTEGRDVDEARTMVRDAIEMLLESYRDCAARDAPKTAIWETVVVEVPII